MMNSEIGAEKEEERSPQSVLPTEKRKHADDSPPQSKPIPPEKRSCVVQPPHSLPLESGNTYDESSDDDIGDLGGNFFVSEEKDEYRDFTGVCSNPFISLNFKENRELNTELKVFAEKAIPHCNAILKTDLRFQDFEEVTSCQSDCSHHSVRMNVMDPLNNISLVILRGRLRSGGTFAVANLHDFLIIGAYKA